jgi:tRNA threonylcarbamoyladenosine biosynthesis protein TsaE
VVETIDFLSTSPEDTAMLGLRLAAVLKPGDVLALTGVIGAGKSVMARAVAGGLGVRTAMASPSFVIVATYEGTPVVHHIDLYRVRDLGEAVAAGVEEAINSDAVSIIEWADRVPDLLPQDRIDLRLEPGEGREERLISLRPAGERAGERLYALLAAALRGYFR